MVQRGSAVVEDTAGIELPRFSIDSDGDGLGSNGGFQISAVSLFNISVSRDLVSTGIGLAGLVNSLVGIGSFGCDSLSFDVLESVIHQSSVASHVSVALRAINQLLFRQGDQRSRGLGEL